MDPAILQSSKCIKLSFGWIFRSKLWWQFQIPFAQGYKYAQQTSDSANVVATSIVINLSDLD
jgi:hypothetical protein